MSCDVMQKRRAKASNNLAEILERSELDNFSRERADAVLAWRRSYDVGQKDGRCIDAGPPMRSSCPSPPCLLATAFVCSDAPMYAGRS